MVVVSHKMGGGLADIGRIAVGEVRAVVSGHIGVVVRKVCADSLAVHPLEIIVGLAVRRDRKVKIPGAHAQRLQVIPHHGVGPQNMVRGHDRFGLGLIVVHHLHPADIFLCLCVVDDVRAIQHGAVRVEGRVFIVQIRRDDAAAVLPVVQVLRGITAHAPGPDAVLPVGFLLVFAVPVVGSVHIHDRAPVGLNPLPTGIQPYLPGFETVIHICLLIHE